MNSDTLYLYGICIIIGLTLIIAAKNSGLLKCGSSKSYYQEQPEVSPCLLSCAPRFQREEDVAKCMRTCNVSNFSLPDLQI